MESLTLIQRPRQLSRAQKLGSYSAAEWQASMKTGTPLHQTQDYLHAHVVTLGLLLLWKLKDSVAHFRGRSLILIPPEPRGMPLLEMEHTPTTVKVLGLFSSVESPESLLECEHPPTAYRRISLTPDVITKRGARGVCQGLRKRNL